MRIVPILLAAAPLLLAQDADLLPRIRAKMREVLLRQPNYTCTETIERTRQTPGGRPIVQDTLRLEVALVEGKEMFAWPGSKQFDDRGLSDLIATGMFGNGNFAIYARILFLSNVAVVEERGEAKLNGRPVWRYDFRVSRFTSGHRLRVDNREAVVGFHGSFYADPVTFDVQRIEVIAEEIPPELNLLDAETTVDYGRLRIGEEVFLLPVESQMMMAVPTDVSRNSIRFADCRKFTGESTLLFDDPVLSETSLPAAPAEVAIPAGLTLQLRMPELDLMRAAVGDSIRATLRFDLKDRRQLLAPKGSVASGRIVRLDRYPNYFLLQIVFQDLNWPGGHAGLKLHFVQPGFATQLIGRRVDGSIEISREVGARLSGILMVWRMDR